MKIEVERKDLLVALNACKGVTPRNDNIPILNHSLLEVDLAGLTVGGTNRDCYTSCDCPCVVNGIGSVCVPSDLFYRSISAMPDRSISLELSGEQLSLTCGPSSMFMQTLPAGEYPKFKKYKETYDFKLFGYNLSRLLDKTKSAQATNQTRFQLLGVRIIADGKKITSVASNTSLVSTQSITIDEAIEIEGITIPSGAVSEILRLTKSGESVRVFGGEEVISVEIGPVRFSARLIDADFPPYLGLFDAEYETHVTIDRKDLLAATKRVSNFAHGNDELLRFDFNGDAVKISNEVGGLSGASDEVAIDSTGLIFSYGFHAKRLADVLQNIETQDVCLTFDGEDQQGKNCQILPDTPDGFKALLVPYGIQSRQASVAA